jgi:hypothetical protein
MLGMVATLAVVTTLAIGGCKPPLVIVDVVAVVLPPSGDVCPTGSDAECKSEVAVDEFGDSP